MRFLPVHPSSLGHPGVLAQFVQQPPDGNVFLPSTEERCEYGIAQPLQEIGAVECAVEPPRASGSKELAVVFVESSDQRVFQDSTDFFIYLEGQFVDVRGGFSRLLCGKKFFQLAVNAFPVFLVGPKASVKPGECTQSGLKLPCSKRFKPSPLTWSCVSGYHSPTPAFNPLMGTSCSFRDQDSYFFADRRQGIVYGCAVIHSRHIG